VRGGRAGEAKVGELGPGRCRFPGRGLHPHPWPPYAST
jgi:hypothetical protein